MRINLGTTAVIDVSTFTAIMAIVLGTIGAVLAASGQPGGPLEGQFWISPVVGGITALAALLRKRGGGND